MTITKVPAGRMRGDVSQGFGVEILYPGLTLTSDDSGIGPIGRIDRAQVQSGHLIGMHPHKDDEILTYIRGGEMLHRDTVGNEAKLDKTHFMMMNAGHTFQHEELMLGDRPVRALQIFLRPNAPDLEPMVQFHEFPEEYSVDSWRLIAGPSAAPLKVRSDIRVFDARIAEGVRLRLPAEDTGRNTLLYVYSGKVSSAGETISEGVSAFMSDGDLEISALSASDVLLFSFAPDADVYRGGMFSGNQRRTT
ncbi:pirin family protein [Agrobacterium pusense]|uniref:pirin family protein n=1 Tax=Agrobacterium pusense TaxID=648995 RepID=UPI001C6E9024|nr:pirin family protein [Agrobacterium pusense]MBW9070082.1 pirin family protein [Agrobacterium pusense]MBW9085078.1 pirin family protein [Agrobacterium pusense]MBW9125447.1 pirin family protein [Agrobacterium pusense]MBW9137862.1 pirin family protein [Agrobacterium pusense]